jgi:hypothetical protein
MRETRTSGSEGGGAEPNRPSLPLSIGAISSRRRNKGRPVFGSDLYRADKMAGLVPAISVWPC